jgi:hypothetical protein
MDLVFEFYCFIVDQCQLVDFIAMLIAISPNIKNTGAL